MTRKQKFMLGGAIAALGIGGTFLGLPSHHGKDPSDRIWGSFEPAYYNVVYIKFGDKSDEPKFEARHAYFPAASEAENDDVECAVLYLKTNGTSIDDCGVVPPLPIDPESKAPERPPISYNFEHFGHTKQQRVYVLVDNADIQFNKVQPMSFTPWGAFDKPKYFLWWKLNTKDKNRTFSDAIFADGKIERLGNLSNDTQTLENTTGLKVKNYYRDAYGFPMGEGGKTDYSINFNLLMCLKKNEKGTCDFEDEKQVIPIVVDPDTSNGRGRPR